MLWGTACSSCGHCLLAKVQNKDPGPFPWHSLVLSAVLEGVVGVLLPQTWAVAAARGALGSWELPAPAAPSPAHRLHHLFADLERQLEEQKKLAKDQKAKSQTIQNVVLMPVSAPKPPKRPRLQRPASATVLSPSTPIQQPQFTVISPIAIAPVGQQFSVGNIPVATISQGSSPVTVHTLPSGSQLFRYATVVSSSKTSSSDTVTLHPSSSLALLSSAAMQDSGALANVAAVVNPVELVAMESGLTSTIQAVEGTSDDGQTIIEIDPAPDPEADADEAEGKAVILETELRTEEKVVGDVEDHQHQVHNVEIVVLED